MCITFLVFSFLQIILGRITLFLLKTFTRRSGWLQNSFTATVTWPLQGDVICPCIEYIYRLPRVVPHLQLSFKWWILGSLLYQFFWSHWFLNQAPYTITITRNTTLLHFIVAYLSFKEITCNFFLQSPPFSANLSKPRFNHYIHF